MYSLEKMTWSLQAILWIVLRFVLHLPGIVLKQAANECLQRSGELLMLWRPTHPLQDGENPSEPPGEGFDLQIKTTYYDSVIDSLCVYCVCQCSRAIFPLFPKCPILVDWEEQQHESRRLIEPVIQYIWTDPYQFCFPHESHYCGLNAGGVLENKKNQVLWPLLTKFIIHGKFRSNAMLSLHQIITISLWNIANTNERFLMHFSTF